MMAFIYGFIAGAAISSVAAFLIGRKHPKIADAIATEANKLTGKANP